MFFQKCYTFYRKITRLFFCRIHDKEKVAEACTTVIGRLVSFDVDQDTIGRLSLLEPNYDVFLSYSHFNEDVAKNVTKELRIYRPDINIFIDTAELKAGGAWQEALYEAIGEHNMFVHAYIYCVKAF